MKMELVACEILQISIVLYSVLLECLFESVTEASHSGRETNETVSKKIKYECRPRVKSVGLPDVANTLVSLRVSATSARPTLLRSTSADTG
jgi:hypothetical protein